MVIATETHLVEDVVFEDLRIGTLFTFMGSKEVKLKVDPTSYYCFVRNVLYTDKDVEGLLTMTVSEYQGRLELRNE